MIIPVCVYTASYFPYAVARGNMGGAMGMIRQSLTWPFTQLPQYLSQVGRVLEDGTRQGFFDVIPNNSGHPVEIMLQNQHFMFTYHQGVHTPTPMSPTGISGFSTAGLSCTTVTWTCLG